MGDDDREEIPPVVAIGASAGGLDAMRELLEGLPDDTGMAFVYLAHLTPEHESRAPEALAKHTGMPVEQAEEGAHVEPDHLYVIPPDATLTLEGGRLRLGEAPPRDQASNVIDRFFRSLADEQGPRAIGVILSGALSDGAAGLREIRAAGGYTMVQDPTTATSRSMPETAIQTGHVDRVGDPEELAGEIARLGREGLSRPALEDPAAADSDLLAEVFERVREGVGVDFSRYKKSTVGRRLHRRMVATGAGDLEAYLERLRDDPDEVMELYHEFLIQVTGFFRDPDSFEEVEEHVVPRLLEGRDPDDEIRVWVPACATGEEAYSIAMLLEERIRDEGRTHPVRVFATDVSEHAIRTARQGVYPKAIEADVDPERLERFFVEADGGYRVHKRIRASCVFATQDITRDPPFSNMDLVSCRNLLIYLEPDLQERVASVLHYALEPDGILLVGPSERLDRAEELFERLDPDRQIYRKRDVTSPLVRGYQHQTPPALDRDRRDEPAGWSDERLRREADRVMLDRYAPPCVVVNPDLEIIEFRGETERYLRHGPGDPNLNLMSMARKGLTVDLEEAIREAREDGEPVRRQGVRVRQGDGVVTEVGLEVVPVRNPGSERSNLLVIFHEVAGDGGDGSSGEDGTGLVDRLVGALQRPGAGAEEEIARLEEELEATRSYLQSVIEDYEATTEELRSANEEALSTNEELQSTNEELQMAKEEVQSTNEELQTVNEELQERNQEVQRINDDLVNLLESVDMPIVMLDDEMRIRRFTPRAEEDLGLLPADVDRPITDLSLPLELDDLEATIGEVVDGSRPVEREVDHRDGRCFSLRITPYRTAEDEIVGTVLTMRELDVSS